jgi:hypothetical protein
MLSGNRTKVIRLDDKLRVKPSPSLLADLKQLLGLAAWADRGRPLRWKRRLRRRAAAAGTLPRPAHRRPQREDAESLPGRQQLT